jgi:hypothetical protein
MIHRQKIELTLINLACGAAVLASYGYGLTAGRSSANALWGDVPEWLIPLYTASMITAACGYLLFTFFILFKINPDEAIIAGRCRYRLFHLIYGAILAPSALWMPLTVVMLREPSSGLWMAIRLVLGAVGLGSIGMIAALMLMRPRHGALAFRLAVAGAAAFAIQTALLDALVWTAYFPFNLW